MDMNEKILQRYEKTEPDDLPEPAPNCWFCTECNATFDKPLRLYRHSWISKEDTGTESNTEKEKGLASDSFKRACFCWGIGRELYTTPVIQIPTEFADVKDNNGRKTTYDKFFVRDLEVTESESGAKSITKIGIGIEHRGQKDWVYAWSAEKGEKTHKPSWIS